MVRCPAQQPHRWVRLLHPLLEGAPAPLTVNAESLENALSSYKVIYLFAFR